MANFEGYFSFGPISGIRRNGVFTLLSCPLQHLSSFMPLNEAQLSHLLKNEKINIKLLPSFVPYYSEAFLDRFIPLVEEKEVAPLLRALGKYDLLFPIKHLYCMYGKEVLKPLLEEPMPRRVRKFLQELGLVKLESFKREGWKRLLSPSLFISKIEKKLLQLANRKYPHDGAHRLVKDKVSKYLSSLEPNDRLFAKAVLDNTTYIPYSRLISDLRLSFRQFLEEIKDKPYYILVDFKKYGSDFFLLSRMLDLVSSSSSFQGFIDGYDRHLLYKGVNLCYIDDAVFSGTHALSLIDELFSDPYFSFSFYLVAPYQTLKNQLTKSIKGFKGSLKRFYQQEIKPISDFYFGDLEEAGRRFGLEEEDLPSPFYSDIKVANEFGSFPQIYLDSLNPSSGAKGGSLLSKNPSKYIM